MLPLDWMEPFSHRSTIETAESKSALDDTPGSRLAFAPPADHATVIGHNVASAASDEPLDRPPPPPPAKQPGCPDRERLLALSGNFLWQHGDELLAGIFFTWMGGLAICESIAPSRVVRFDRMIHEDPGRAAAIAWDRRGTGPEAGRTWRSRPAALG